jgi:hypothetical protein
LINGSVLPTQCHARLFSRRKIQREVLANPNGILQSFKQQDCSAPHTVISIEQNSNFSDIEHYFDVLDQSTETDLEIPLRFTENRIGFDAAMIQVIITWARRNKAGYLTPATADPAWLQELCIKEHGLVALLMASQVQSPKGLDLQTESLNELQHAYRQIALQPWNLVDGKLFLVSNLFGKLEHAYDKLSPATATPESVESFKNTVLGALKDSLAICGAKHLSDSDPTHIADILYELFVNAEEWGSKEINGPDIRPNIRGVIIKVHQGLFLSQYDESPPGDYLNHWQAIERRSNFLEVSVFDAGIGLAQHALERPITEETPLKEEYEKVMKCLRKYSTASGRTYRGLGLHYVMQLLTQTKGFLRYRSGRLALFRDFHPDAQPYMSSIGHSEIDATAQSPFRADNVYFYDWRSRSLDLVQAPIADGALFTLIFPLR